MKKISLLRHGDTGYPETYIGTTDIPLSEQGINDLEKTGQYLATREYDRVICSPLTRCRQTCDILGLGSNIEIDERLREIDFGRWEGKTFVEIEKSDPEQVILWAKGKADFTFPQGENVQDFQQRITAFSGDIQLRHEKNILIVAHGGVIRYLICTFLNIASENYLFFKVLFGGVTEIDLYSGGGVMTGFNLGVKNG